MLKKKKLKEKVEEKPKILEGIKPGPGFKVLKSGVVSNGKLFISKCLDGWFYSNLLRRTGGPFKSYEFAEKMALKYGHRAPKV